MLNIAALNGRLTAEPELKHTGSDIAVTSFTLAVDRGYVKAGAERQADFIEIVCWRQQAEFVGKNFHKGQLVAVEGSIQTRTYTDKQGNKRKATEIVASQVHFAERKPQGSGTGSPEEIRGNAAGAGLNVKETPSGDNGNFVEIGNNDDLPF